jgi:hypothetical protein
VAGYSIKLIFLGGGGVDFFDGHRVCQFRNKLSDNILNSETRVIDSKGGAHKVFRLCDVANKDYAVCEAQFLCN